VNNIPIKFVYLLLIKLSFSIFVKFRSDIYLLYGFLKYFIVYFSELVANILKSMKNNKVIKLIKNLIIIVISLLNFNKTF
jgi:hypothetical protein